ncbi:uncharacterized protein LOC121875400 [Homarus americanus]|uniref:uncharacterized protein LOC121875400 n=1 Tax=Homarus americanus TaxID=6706 RepID=UPI001C488F7D|nr:uncharacterized protein LOC121875400 [Homarus americanus]
MDEVKVAWVDSEVVKDTTCQLQGLDQEDATNERTFETSSLQDLMNPTTTTTTVLPTITTTTVPPPITTTPTITTTANSCLMCNKPLYGQLASAPVSNAVDASGQSTCYLGESSTEHPKPWWLIDLGGKYTITLVEMLTWEGGVSDFKNVEVRVGVSLMTDGDFTTYLLFGFYAGPNLTGEPVTFTSGPGVTGRYLSVQAESSYLDLCDIRIEVQ